MSLRSRAVRALKAALPASAQDRLREVRRTYRRGLYFCRKASGRAPAVTRADLMDGFRKLGIAEGDTLIIHSSLRSLGDVQGGAQAVVDVLRSSLGSGGTLVVPTLTFGGEMWTHFETYDDSRPFDARSTPSRMGKVTEIVRQLPGALRSVHPSHSVAAVGPRAEYLTYDHHRDPRAFGPMSPYGRLCEVGGKILMLGVDLTTMTAFHVIEDLVEAFPFPVYAPGTWRVQVILPTGEHHTMECKVHNPQVTAIRDCNKVEPYFREYAILADTQIGDARVMVIDAGRLNDTMRRLLDRGITIYTPKP